MSTAEVDARGPRRRGGGYARPAPGRGSKFELYAWVFMRVSGLALIVMTLYHLVWWNLVVGVEHVSADLVRERWSHWPWRLFNVGLVLFAMLHGLNGLRYSIEDYVRGPGKQAAAKAVAYTVVLSVLVFGIYALLTFDPAIFFADR